MTAAVPRDAEGAEIFPPPDVDYVAMEAVCRECGETFNPNDIRDSKVEDGVRLWEHYQTSAEEDCGGFGPVTGYWS